MDKLMEFNNVTFKYKDRLVLDGISFDLFKDHKVAIIGANGAGKSTILKLMVGLLKSNSGEILFQGNKITSKNLKEVRKEVGYAFQDADVQLFMPSVYEDVVFFAKQNRFSETRIEEVASKALQSVGIDALKDRAPYSLSGGEKRLASLAVAIANEPKLLILDEPTVGLDPKSRREIINTLSRREESLFIATHDMDFAYDVCDRVIVLHQGKVLIEGSPSDVFNNIKVLEKANLEPPLQLQYKRED